jgi:starch synthase
MDNRETRPLVTRRRQNGDEVGIRILLAASEVVGFAKTGGLADVAGSLPPALARRGLECAVILPLYHCARRVQPPPERTGHVFAVPMRDRMVAGRLWRSCLPGSDVPVYLVEQDEYFDRDEPLSGRGLYQFTPSGGGKRDYNDNCERFIFFCRAVLEALPLLDFWPDVLHANDWQTGLVPVYLRELYRNIGPDKLRSRYERVSTLFTIHNLAYQGLFWHLDMALTGLDWRLFNPRQLEYYGKLSLLKAGIVFADRINTVSPTYAREIQTIYYGCGLQGVLAERRERLSGIVNGVDYRVWDPATDPHLPAHYDADNLLPGKARCKTDLQQREGLAVEPDTPLLGMVARMVEQKGVDLIVKAAPALLEEGVQLILLGEGDPDYHRQLAVVRDRYPGRMSLTIGFHEGLAHRIEAGADLFLMPSLYEPSGLNQLYSMRYGTPPVVRSTGGLADTVVDTSDATLVDGTATGFRFTPYTPDALRDTVRRALTLHRHRPEQWRQLIAAGMRQDWSWDRSAGEYVRLYERIAEERGQGSGVRGQQ